MSSQPMSHSPVGGAAGSGWARPSAWRRLAARVRVRLDPGRRGALAVRIAVLVAAIVTGAWVVAERPRAMAVTGAWVVAERPRAMAVTANASAVPTSIAPIGSPLASGSGSAR